MRIKIPDVEIIGEDESPSKSGRKKEKQTLQEEIAGIICLPKSLSSCIVNGLTVVDTPENRHHALLSFTQFCREEVFPRQIKAIETINSRSDRLHCQLVCQQKDVVRLMSFREELQQGLENLEVKRIQAQAQHRNITDRLNEILGKLQGCCKNKTVGEKRTMQDLKNLEKKAETLRVQMTETKSRANYYLYQVKVQTDSVEKYTKPLYLDKNRTVFLRSSLNSMRQNIEALVYRVKTLNNQTSEMIEANESVQDISVFSLS